MAEFLIPKSQKVTFQTLAKGFGLPLVKRAFMTEQSAGVVDAPDDKKSYLGTPIYDSLFIITPSFATFEYSDVDNAFVKTVNTLNFIDQKGEEIGINIDGVIISANQQKNFVRTEIMGRVGTVKEYINQGDFDITIRGFVASKNPDEYPLQKVQVLQQYLNAPTGLKIVSNFVNNILTVNGKGVDIVVVDNYNLFQQEGVRNIQFFEINCFSDSDNEIKQNNATT